MSLESFFDHKCDIYHLVEDKRGMNYGLPSTNSYTYPDEADEAGVSCHFAVKSWSYSIQQSQPANVYDAKIKLTLPIDTDIRLNDKIVELSTGYEYTAEQPRNVRGHHKFVFIKRLDAQKPL